MIPEEQNAPALHRQCFVGANRARTFPAGLRALENFVFVISWHATVWRTKARNLPGVLETTGLLRCYIEIAPYGAVHLGDMRAVKARRYRHSSVSILAGEFARLLLRTTCRGAHGS